MLYAILSIVNVVGGAVFYSIAFFLTIIFLIIFHLMLSLPVIAILIRQKTLSKDIKWALIPVYNYWRLYQIIAEKKGYETGKPRIVWIITFVWDIIYFIIKRGLRSPADLFFLLVFNIVTMSITQFIYFIILFHFKRIKDAATGKWPPKNNKN
ncbi:MAG: hypothetical protein V1824_04780 [archaeon]